MLKTDHTIDMDLAGRVMAIEQRLKGLQGRTSALEARLSSPESAGFSRGDDASDDFVIAMPSPAIAVSQGSAVGSLKTLTSRQDVPGGGAVAGRLSFNLDVTGLIAGGILIGAGLLMYTGNLDLIKNPLAAMGCGILLAASALWRKVL